MSWFTTQPDAQTQQAALAIANIPSFARRMNAATAATDAVAARVGESDPWVVESRSRLSVAALKLNQVDSAVRAAYARAVAAGKLPDVPIPEVSIDQQGLGAISGSTIFSLVVALTATIAAVVVAFISIPVALVIAVGGAIAYAVAWISARDDAATEPVIGPDGNPVIGPDGKPVMKKTPSNWDGLFSGLLPLAGIALLAFALSGKRSRS